MQASPAAQSALVSHCSVPHTRPSPHTGGSATHTHHTVVGGFVVVILLGDFANDS